MAAIGVGCLGAALARGVQCADLCRNDDELRRLSVAPGCV